MIPSSFCSRYTTTAPGPGIGKKSERDNGQGACRYHSDLRAHLTQARSPRTCSFLFGHRGDRATPATSRLDSHLGLDYGAFVGFLGSRTHPHCLVIDSTGLPPRCMGDFPAIHNSRVARLFDKGGPPPQRNNDGAASERTAPTRARPFSDAGRPNLPKRRVHG